MIDERESVIDVNLEKEMKTSFIDYAMSVIISRALPDVRDGLKPVHRRILYAMYEHGITHDKPTKKCATTVGDVLGSYHPHGDASVYDALVRMAQTFSLRYPLIEGQGNFGSVDGDPPAAYRYTESRLEKIGEVLLQDIEKETVDFMPNFDESKKEPVVIPSRFPQLLANGSSGIAVGMATNIPPHNITELIEGTIALIKDPDITTEGLMKYIKGPDFPTRALIMGTKGIKEAYETGKGRIIMRARAEIEPMSNTRDRIIVTEIPYQVNKARLVERIAELSHDGRIVGISDLRDESDRNGMRIVIELKTDVNAHVILNQLYKYTSLQEAFCANMLAIVDGKPEVLSLKSALSNYIKFQKEVIVRRTRFDLKKAEARVHILEGLRIALDDIDRVIEIIRNSYNDAKQNLIEKIGLTEIQAQAILDMQLRRLAGIEREKIDAEYDELMANIKRYNEILVNEELQMQIVKDELDEVKEQFGDQRRTEIMPSFDDIDDEDLIDEEESVITLTHYGYIKRVPSDTYKSQKRGGRGVIGMATKEEDFVETLFSASTHDHILFFTNKGRMYHLKGYEIPESGRQAKGTAIVNLLPVESGESVSAMIPIRYFDEGNLVMATRNGVIKKTPLVQYGSLRKGSLNAISLDEGDELIEVKFTGGENEIMLGTHKGMAIRFNENDVRTVGRTARGVRGIKLREGDFVIGMSVITPDTDLLCITENGSGKRTDFEEYRGQNRGGIGILTYKITEKTGALAGMKAVSDDNDIMLITNEGVIIRMACSDISKFKRSTQGVRLMKLDEGVKVVSMAVVEHAEEEEETTENSPEVTETEAPPIE